MSKRHSPTAPRPAQAARLRIPLRVVYYREGGRWVAHCLEFDLAGDGRTQRMALMRLIAAIRIQVNEAVANQNMQSLFSPADGEVFRKFAAGTKSLRLGADAQLSVSDLRIESVEVREYAEPTPALV